MNFIDKFLVYVVLLPKAFYQNMGVNTTQLKAILKTKITLGDRTPTGIRAIRKAKQNKPTSGVSYTQIFMSVFLGVMFMFSFFMGANYVTKLTIYFSMYIFVLTSTLIADFTTVLIDVRDNFIILPKPVNDKTVLLSRLLYIVIYISKSALPMTLIGMGFMAYVNGIWGLLLFIVFILLATLLTIFFINAIYILVLKITTPQKFKSIISYFQIGLAILMYASYQLVPRLIKQTTLDNYNLENSTLAMFAPPYWFAGAWQYLFAFEGGFKLVLCVLLSIAIPILSIWVVIKYFAPSFNQKLAMISGTSEEPSVNKSGKIIKSTTSKYLTLLSKFFTQKGAERMSFLHTWKMTSRSRDFKMKVYPSLGYLAVYIVLLFVNNKGDEGRLTLPEPNSFFYIFIVYFCNFVLITALGYLTFSDKYKAAWIYYITPIQKPGHFILGSVKSILFKFYFPLVIVIISLAYLLLGLSAFPNFILGICNQVLIIFVIAYISFKDLPFSVQAGNKIKGSSFVRGLFSMLIPLSIGVLHYFIRDFLPIVILLIVLSAIAIWMMMDSIKNKTWETIKVQSDF
jgi:ABC-2 type transport system permease protein